MFKNKMKGKIMKLSRRNAMRKFMSVLVGCSGFVLLGRKARATNKKDELNQFLDEGGQLVVKRQSSGNIVAIETIIEGQAYHMGIAFQTSEDLLKNWKYIVKSGLIGIRRKKAQLKGETNV